MLCKLRTHICANMTNAIRQMMLIKLIELSVYMCCGGGGFELPRQFTLNNLIASLCSSSECTDDNDDVIGSLVCNKIGCRHKTQSINKQTNVNMNYMLYCDINSTN